MASLIPKKVYTSLGCSVHTGLVTWHSLHVCWRIEPREKSMSLLRISLFGSAQLQHLDSPIKTSKMTRAIQVLLAYLLMEHRRLHPREVLADIFWADNDIVRARKCLNTTV
jgi:hypothetical protein